MYNPRIRRILKWSIPPLALILLIVYLTVAYFMASGLTKAERHEQDDIPSAHDLAFHDVTFPSRGGDVELSGWHITRSADPQPTIIFVHGLDSVRSARNTLDIAARLSALGYDSLLFDLRAHGSSGGGRLSGGYFERMDVLGAYDYLIQHGVPPEKIGLLGFSLGGASAIMAAADEPSIRAVVADSSFAAVEDLIGQEMARKTIFPEWSARFLLPAAKLFAKQFYDVDLGKLKPEKDIARITYPLLLIHGSLDTRVPYAHSTRLQKASPQSVLWLAEKVDHVDSFNTYPEEYILHIASYFDSRLKTASGSIDSHQHE